MPDVTLSGALEREHREIDKGIEDFTMRLAAGTRDTAPLKRATEALRRHIYLEEEFLFPPLRNAGMMAPVFVMLREHGEIWQAMDGLEKLLADGAEPAVLADACRALLAQLDQHNSKEEPIIYPRVDQVLPGPASTELLEFLDTGRTPPGWVCERARS